MPRTGGIVRRCAEAIKGWGDSHSMVPVRLAGAEVTEAFWAKLVGLLVHVLPTVLTDGGASTVMVSLSEYERLLQPKQRMEEMARPLLAKGLKVETLITRGDPASEIVKIAKQKAADIIVIATHGKTGWRHLAFGSVAEKVVRTASCPVLSIRCAVRGAASSDGAR